MYAWITHCAQGHEFTPENTGLDGGHRYCRTCKRARFHAWRNKKVGAKERCRENWLLWKYNMTRDDFIAMLKEQNERCLVCGLLFSPDKGLDPVVDHCHVTGENRGLLHRKCNLAIGILGDSPEAYEKAADYFRKFVRRPSK